MSPGVIDSLSRIVDDSIAAAGCSIESGRKVRTNSRLGWDLVVR